VVKKLLLIAIFMGIFQGIHIKATDLALETASETLKKVSPRNFFIKKWYEPKVRTASKSNWGFIDKFAIPNLNDLLATAFYLLAKVSLWLLKLIYSTVYHLTYIFSGITAILYFFELTSGGIKGTIRSAVWCMILPFVIAAILALVGNTIDERALKGDLAIADIETIIWLFGICLILLLAPMITFVLIRSEGIAGAGAQIGNMAVKGLTTAAVAAPIIIKQLTSARNKIPTPGNIKNAYQRVSGAFRKKDAQKLDGVNKLSKESIRSSALSKNQSVVKSALSPPNKTEAKTEQKSFQNSPSNKTSIQNRDAGKVIENKASGFPQRNNQIIQKEKLQAINQSRVVPRESVIQKSLANNASKEVKTNQVKGYVHIKDVMARVWRPGQHKGDKNK
ncbi:MAG: hypothetical protein WCG27_11155, partial [Pseudomonadota bacterium]